MTEVTQILHAIAEGDPHAASQLPLVYDELRQLAAQKLGHETPGRRFSPPLWSTRRTCGWWRAPDGSPGRSRTGTAAATSSPPRRRPCAVSSSRTPAANRPSSTAV